MGELNLIPYSFKEKRKKALKIKKYVSIAIIVLCILFGCVAAPMLYLNSLADKKTNLMSELDKANALLAENQKLKIEIANLKTYTDKVDYVTKQKKLITDRVRGIEKHMPKTISLSGLSYTSDSIIMNGVAKDYNSIAEFGANLQQSKEYSKALITNIHYLGTGTNYGFTINIDNNGGEAK